MALFSSSVDAVSFWSATVTPCLAATSVRMAGQRAWTTASIVAAVCAAAFRPPTATRSRAVATGDDRIGVRLIIGAVLSASVPHDGEAHGVVGILVDLGLPLEQLDGPTVNRETDRVRPALDDVRERPPENAVTGL